MKEDIKFEYMGILPPQIFSISEVDLCTVLSNALKNAVEATAQAEEKKIGI